MSKGTANNSSRVLETVFWLLEYLLAPMHLGIYTLYVLVIF